MTVKQQLHKRLNSTSAIIFHTGNTTFTIKRKFAIFFFFWLKLLIFQLIIVSITTRSQYIEAEEKARR